ncbi:dTDP-4-dehydrorhamnose reductase [Desulfovibrio aminophilus]|uniref:dTDP-4-dehydrorhamnose reductase n=1 Tax=Desulfovibrio aminophilus TaxID=81425 RepID=UPI003392FDEC
MSALAGAKVAVFGGRRGMLGQALTRALERSKAVALPLSSQDFDPLDAQALESFLDRQKPDMAFNAAAYTAVDQAEDEPQAAYRLNRDLPALLGRLCAERGVRLLHFSTDFVFDGRGHEPLRPGDATGPLSVYGASKLAGEEALRGLPGVTVARTAWLYGPGRTNFVAKILELAKTRESLNVVHDQEGSPTYTPDLAALALALAASKVEGVLHLANSGRATWCELAAEAVHLAGLPCRVQPIPSSAWPSKAARPAFSVLDTSAFTEATGVTPRPWNQALRDYVFGDLGLGV